MPRYPRRDIPATARVLSVLEAADGPVGTEAMREALHDIPAVTIRAAIWKLRNDGLVSKDSPWHQYELTDVAEARRSQSRLTSVQLLRLAPTGRMLLTLCDGARRISVQLTGDQAAEYGRELIDFAKGARKAGIALGTNNRSKHANANWRK